MRLDRARLTTYLVWSTWAGIAFFSVYPTMNWLTAMRGHTHRCYFDWELKTPFVPHFIWVYLSMYALFLTPPLFMEPPALRALGRQVAWGTLVSGLIFLLFPATLGFPRVLPDDPYVDGLYSGMFALDRPHNLVPSLHVVWSGAIALAVGDSVGHWGRWLFSAWLGLIALSTLLVHQHHLADVVVAFVLVVSLRRVFKGTKRVEAHPAGFDRVVYAEPRRGTDGGSGP